MKVFKKIKLFSMFLILFLIFGSLTISATELIATTSEQTSGTGNYSIKLPDTTTGEKYDVTLGIISQYNDGSYVYASNEVYYVNVTNADGTSNTELSAYYIFKAEWNNIHELQERVVTIEDVPEGSTVAVENILVIKDEYDAWGSPLTWSNYSITYMAATVANSYSADAVLVDYDGDLIQLTAGETVSQTTKTVGQEAEQFVRETEDDFFDVHYELFGAYFEDGYYDEDFLTYLLSTYNVVSLDEINSTHIVGPIISQNIAERTADADDGTVYEKLIASDYSNGVPSYVGDFSMYDGNNISVALNYIFDVTQNPYFTAPFFYSEEDGLLIEPTGETSNLLDYYVVDGYEEKALSSNNSGLTYTYQNDDFIDFTNLSSALIEASNTILTDGNAEGYSEFIRYEFEDIDGTFENAIIRVYENDDLVKTITYSNGEYYDGKYFSDFVTQASYYSDHESGIRLTINMEESWTIVSAINLEEVNMILPDDYDYYDNPYMAATTINFECEYINKTWYEFEKDLDGDGIAETVASWHSVMPYTLINGDEYDANGSGEDIEYGEVGNKIIWNMPNLVTDTDPESETYGDNRLTVLNTSHNIAGHIVAPQAEFWNYDENGNWLGGNLNGAAIFKSFYSGVMEMHMWAYTGLAEQATVFGVEAIKTVNETAPEQEYTFMLDVVYENDGSIPNGIMNNTFPMYASSEVETGEVSFSSVAFNEAGTYSFIVKEDTSMDTPTDNVTYDLTQYRIDITVEISADSDDDTIIYEITETKKYKIVDSDGVELETPELLDEILDVCEFTFNNLVSEQETVSLTLYKYCSTGHTLPGARFYVTEMNETGTEVITNGYFESVTSVTDGKIIITGLEKGTYYKIEEFESAYGHVKGDGYWVAYIDANGFLGSITAHDGADEIASDLIIYNDPAESALLDLTLTKSNEILDLIEGVEFKLQRVMVDSSGAPQTVVGGYSEEYITAEDGTFTIYDLEAGNIYMLTETTTPDGHKVHYGYWLIEVTGNALFPSNPLTYTITEYDNNNKVVSTVSNNIILNDLIDYTLPITGGIGNTIFYITGTALMFGSVIIYIKKKQKLMRRKEL